MRAPTSAAAAERLQFTVGAGPCMTAQETRQPVFAVEDDLRRRWPVFTDLLVGSTPFRAVVALPLQPALAGAGAIDLYFERPTRCPTSTSSRRWPWASWSPPR